MVPPQGRSIMPIATLLLGKGGGLWQGLWLFHPLQPFISLEQRKLSKTWIQSCYSLAKRFLLVSHCTGHKVSNYQWELHLLINFFWFPLYYVGFQPLSWASWGFWINSNVLLSASVILSIQHLPLYSLLRPPSSPSSLNSGQHCPLFLSTPPLHASRSQTKLAASLPGPPLHSVPAAFS